MEKWSMQACVGSALNDGELLVQVTEG